MAQMSNEYKREWMRRWRAKNPARDKANRHRFARAHPHYARDYWRANKTRLLQAINWEQRAKYVKLGVDRISDDYVRRRLSFKTAVPMRQWPAALVEAKRAHLKLQRLIKTYGSTTKH